VLLLAALILFVFYRPQLRQAWREAAGVGNVRSGA
jgi:hypothetical protein